MIRSKIEDPERSKFSSEIRHAERNIAINAWSKWWNRTIKAAWTHRVLPDLRRWVSKSPKDFTFHVTGASGTISIGWDETRYAECLYCGHLEQTLFAYPHCEIYLRDVRACVGGRSIAPKSPKSALWNRRHPISGH